MLIDIHVLLPLLLGDFGSKVFHDATALALGSDIDNGPELAALDLLSRERRSNPDDHTEVLA
jgi:hypothetical protein